MAPLTEATSTSTALEPRETRFYYNNGDCGDKTIYICRPGIIFAIIGSIIIGGAVIFYTVYSISKNQELMEKLDPILKRLLPCFRRRRKRNTRKRNTPRRAKSDLEMTIVDFDGKPVTSDPPKDFADTEDNHIASASNSRHVHFSGSS
ncbi:hypothetical protein N8I77_002528 [Diaporthe amygdali]|uniref:Uncharacterized protein n=1 Tax=Phomopsis amygdali TaxID=1214568 RepID=A0AAD9SUB6_PHOAM|nr:hypothetical protein N8I77_002528 [Diaporthe amygdali]